MRSSTFALGGVTAGANRLVKLAPGHYTTRLSNDDELCRAIEFDVKGGDAITYVYVEDREMKVNGSTCYEPTRVRVHHFTHLRLVEGKK